MEHIKLKDISQSTILSIEMNLREIGYLQHKDYKIHSAWVASYFRNGGHVDYHENTTYQFEVYNDAMTNDARVKTMLSHYIA